MLRLLKRAAGTAFAAAGRLRAWRVRKRLGLAPLSTPPVTAIPLVDREKFARSGYVPKAVPLLPYERQGMDYQVEDELLDLADPGVPVDDYGIALWRDPKGEAFHHPVTIAQYGLAALGGYTRTNDLRYLERALANAERLVDLGEIGADDVLWFPYHFPHTYYDVTMPVPWWSGMAQGQALSLFSRLAEFLPAEERWATLAARTFASFDAWRALGKPWITTMDDAGYLWFEEYAGDVEPLLVVNGHVFAVYGLYDYIRLTGSASAIDLFDGGATTVLHYVDTFRVPGGVSYYCVRAGYCQRPEWQNVSYHSIHVQQLRMLGLMTGDTRFAEAALGLESDWNGDHR